MGFFKDDLKKVRAFIFDVDGVLSLATQNLTPEGELVRTSCTGIYYCRHFRRGGSGST